MRIFLLTSAVVASCAGALPVFAAVLTFENDRLGNDLAHGDRVDGADALLDGLTISVTGPNSNQARIYDTNVTGGADPDLEAPFDNPNTGVTETFFPGNVLIIQDNNLNNIPNDDRGGGVIRFTFAQPVTFLSLDYFDTDDSGGSLSVSLFDVGNNLIGTFNPAGASVGDNEFGTFVFPAASSAPIAGFSLGGSGAIDNVAFNVPEPATLALVGAGLAGLGLASRRRGRAG